MKAILLLLIGLAGLAACAEQKSPPQETGMQLRKLSAEEERVIVHKGTERPFSGKYDKHSEQGTYVCKRCHAPLYRSTSKFDSRCGWPSFDLEIPGAVSRHPDPDGARTEIVCSRCGAHLGHVFLGEGFTALDTRHCVNSISLEFVPQSEEATLAPRDTAYFAGGCFWGTQHHFAKVPGVLSTAVGYMGGTTAHPTYPQVSSGRTGHLEANQIVFDPTQVSYTQLLQLFFEIHDFSQTDGQGPDLGPQYLSAIFPLDEIQRKQAQAITAQLRAKGYSVATTLRPAAPFYPAEDYHQLYYQKNGKTPYCHFRRKIFD